MGQGAWVEKKPTGDEGDAERGRRGDAEIKKQSVIGEQLSVIGVTREASGQ